MHELVCPLCRVALEPVGDGWRCPACGRGYPMVAGVLDLRTRSDRYLSLEGDRAKAETLASVEGPFEAVLRAYWDLTPEVPADLARQYVATALDGERRAAALLEGVALRGRSLLDVGCGTGGLVAAAAAAGAEPVGVDIALRWLVVAARRLSDRGFDVPLVAADGALLPYRPGSFDVVTCVEVLEHTHDQRGLLHGCLGAARPAGTVRVVTSNRRSLAREPNVQLYGVGWLPRRLAIAYVAWRRKTRYQHFRAVSPGEVLAMLGPEPPAAVVAGPLPVPPPAASAARRVADRVYGWASGRRRLARLLRAVAPYLEVRREGGQAVGPAGLPE